MKFLSTLLGVFVTLMMLTSAFATSEYSHEVVKYVQGGARPGGNGSKKRPFSSLADAEQHNWDVLFVLSSPFDLDGGITLKPGQKLIGEEDPTGIAVSPTQPTIINTGTTNGGNGVVVTGDATIKNIFFNNTNKNGIDTTQAENLTVQNVRITGFNQNPVLFSSFGIGGFEQKSGVTRLENVIISNPSGKGFSGIFESLSANGIHRKFLICNCEFTQLHEGIFIQVANPDTTSTLKIENSYFHDFFANGIGIFGLLFNNSQQTMLLKNSTFYNVGVGNGATIFVEPQQTSQLELKIDSSSFEEILIPNTAQGVIVDSFNNSSTTISVEHSTFTNMPAIEPASFDASSIKMEVEDSTFNNTPFAIEPASFDASSIDTLVKCSIGNNVTNFFTPLLFAGQQTNKLCGNTVSGGTFYTTNTGSSSAVELSTLEGNVFSGSIGFLVESPPAGVAWKLLEINAEHNCFNGGNAAGSIGFDVQSGNHGSIAIRAHENSFAGFVSDITDGGSSASYLVSKNFWGTPTKTCTSTSMCGQYQLCENNLCLGPTTNLTIPGFTGFIDASKPLSTSINCPSSCSPSQSGTQTPLPQTIKLSAEEMREMLEKKKAFPAQYQPTEAVQIP